MLRVCLTLGFALAIVSRAVASPSADIVTAAQGFINAFNSGNMKAAAATCASPASIIDDDPPHEWQGATACSDWARDYRANAKQNGITEPHVALGKPLHAYVDGNTGYVVLPAVYTWKQNGKPTTLDGIFTVALRKAAGGWRITGWAWTDH